ncbi:MAG: deoxyribose-phosphate aldolase [Planctomycetia bacterium]|nr:deoxyribose-phosphate aldolase [Planctomycetia bacterium]
MNFANMLDVTAVRGCNRQDVEDIEKIAWEYQCKAVFSLPCFAAYLKSLIDKRSPQEGIRPLLGGTVGFPDGGETTSTKVFQTQELLSIGCDEIDMVLNYGFLCSGMYKEVVEDVAAVKRVMGNVPLKVILECHYLSNEQIVLGSQLAVQGGADWIKTSTGWAPTGATLENVALIKKTVGDKVYVKAAGGIRDLETIKKMYELGVDRFGIGIKTCLKVLNEIKNES